MALAIVSSASAKVPSPFKAADLAEFIAAVPADAEITVGTVSGGDQRDPYPASYSFNAKWDGSR